MSIGRLHRPMLEDQPIYRSTAAGMIAVTRNPTPPRTPPPPDFLSSLMSSELKFRTSVATPPRSLPRPVFGRDEQGCLCSFSSDKSDQISSKPGPGGWARCPSFDGLASSQRGLPPCIVRKGPGPEATMPHTYVPRDLLEPARPLQRNRSR